jgi:phage baseplate assembly protein gpV
MNAYLGTVSNVDADARRVQVSLPHLHTLTKPLRCVSPFGLVAPLPAVGDEVLILAPHGHMTDAVVVGWIPQAADVAGAADHPLIASEGGGVPTQSDPSQDVGNATTAGVLSRG